MEIDRGFHIVNGNYTFVFALSAFTGARQLTSYDVKSMYLNGNRCYSLLVVIIHFILVINIVAYIVIASTPKKDKENTLSRWAFPTNNHISIPE